MKLLIALFLLATALAGAPGTDAGTTNLCAAMTCLIGTRCEVINGRGVCTMCPLVRCVPCQEGLVRHYDEDGCQTCQCRVKTCKDIKCPTGKFCKLRDTGMRCVRAPCASFVPECVAVVACPQIGCAPCADGERLEQIKDANGCLTGCKCHQQRPCATHKCEDDQICIDIIPECFPQSGCPPSAECRECHVPECLKYVLCRYGVAKDRNGCYSRTCKCNPPPIPIEPCGLKCPVGYSCVHNGAREYCVQCHVPECLKFVWCRYGVAKDSNGCYSRTCKCNPPPIPREPCGLKCPPGYACVNNGARDYCVR